MIHKGFALLRNLWTILRDGFLRKKTAVLLDFIQVRGGGQEPFRNVKPDKHRCLRPPQSLI